MFSCEFCKIFRNTFCTEDLWATASIFDQVYCFVAKRQTDLKLLLIIAVTYYIFNRSAYEFFIYQKPIYYKKWIIHWS